MTGRLKVDKATGRITGPVSISYNHPWPTTSGSWGSGAMMGVIMHTMVGNLPNTITVFNDPNPPDGLGPRSAHFGIDQQGHVHQFGPIGKGWIAWHIAAGNPTWYGIEHADNGNPDIPLTDAQLTASAQLVEALSSFATFPLAISDSVTAKGYGTHAMGGTAWGGHTCPDLPGHHVRSRQRGEILNRARVIRHPAPAPPSAPFTYHADGHTSLRQLAIAHGLRSRDLLWQTARSANSGFGDLQGPYINAGNWDAVMPSGMIVQVGREGDTGS